MGRGVVDLIKLIEREMVCCIGSHWDWLVAMNVFLVQQ
jgi:hypothetical protein